MRLMALDLEMNTDGTSRVLEDLIQIGITVFDTYGEIHFTKTWNIKIDKPLYPYIVKLTGIKQWENDAGVSLATALEELHWIREDYVITYNVVTWGGGDLSFLRDEANKQSLALNIGGNECNAKSLYQVYQMANGGKRAGGLKASIKQLGLEWQVWHEEIKAADGSVKKIQRSCHNAGADSLNTAIIFLEFMKRIKYDNRESLE